MWRTCVTIVLAVCASSQLRAAEVKELPEMHLEPLVYDVTRLSGPVEIDANWDKPAWQNVEPLVISKHMGDAPDHRPGVRAKLAWDSSAVYVIFRVEDRYVRAVAEEYQDAVCRDSCVEFFFTPGADLGLSYFNVEINCGGTMLFWWHPEGKKAVPVAAEDGEKVQIAHSLPRTVEPEIAEHTTWTLEYRLPFAVVRKYCPAATRPAHGGAWRANLYKCGDRTSHPHWLTWSYVDHPTPRFHMPQHFGTLRFE